MASALDGITVLDLTHGVAGALATMFLCDNGASVEYEHPTLGHVRQSTVGIRFVGAAVGPPRPTPLLGEHTAEVLNDVGYSVDQVAELCEKGVVKTSSQ